MTTSPTWASARLEPEPGMRPLRRSPTEGQLGSSRRSSILASERTVEFANYCTQCGDSVWSQGARSRRARPALLRLTILPGGPSRGPSRTRASRHQIFSVLRTPYYLTIYSSLPILRAAVCTSTGCASATRAGFGWVTVALVSAAAARTNNVRCRIFVALSVALWVSTVIALLFARRLPAAAMVRRSLRVALSCNAVTSAFLCVGGARSSLPGTLTGSHCLPLPVCLPPAPLLTSHCTMTRLIQCSHCMQPLPCTMCGESPVVPKPSRTRRDAPLLCPYSGALFPDIACASMPAASATMCAAAASRAGTIVMACQTILLQARHTCPLRARL